VILYIDTSALGRVYLGDQSDSTQLSHIVYDGDRPVITSELTDVEIASTVARASRAGAITAATADELLDTGTQPTPPTPDPWASSASTATPSLSRSGTSCRHRCAPWMRSTWPPAHDSAIPRPTRCGCCPVTTGKTRRLELSASSWPRNNRPLSGYCPEAWTTGACATCTQNPPRLDDGAPEAASRPSVICSKPSRTSIGYR